MNSKKDIRVAVVGSKKSGKTVLTEKLSSVAQDKRNNLVFNEVHNLDELHGHAYDVVLQVVDCTNLEESLMLTPHIVDEEEKIVLAFNRYDQLLATDHHLDLKKLKQLIGIPLELVSAQSGKGLEEVMKLILQTHKARAVTAHPVFHAWEQKDEEAYHGYVHGILTETLVHAKHDTHTGLEKIDRILTNKWFGFPILFVILALVFELTFAIGNPIQDLLQKGVDALFDLTQKNMPDTWYTSLLGNGIILGVGSLLTALPNIIVLFFFLSVMEDTGYLSRVAFLMDGFMHRIGLHGRSFIPMLMGFDCNVPAIMAAKDIQNPKDRTLTMLMIPFMSCSGRLPVYIVIISMFFPKHEAVALMSLYAMGIVISFLFAIIMKHTKWFRQEESERVNELPDFKMPTLQSIGRHIWFRVSDFLQKISTVVLCASIIIWALEYFPACDLDHLETSWIAAIGKALEPIVRPLGFDWKAAVCLLTGVPAKETIGSTFAILFGGDISTMGLSSVTAYAFLSFCVLYFPCVATISTLRREINWKWATFSVVNSLVVAWVVAFIINQIGSLLFA